jgi:hypothetical protein
MVPTASSSAEPAQSRGFEPAVLIGIAVAVLALVCAVVGFVTILRWLMPS